MQQKILQRFDKLFHTYYVNLCRFCYSYVKDTYLAEEIVQEVFITLWEKTHQIEITLSERSFLYTSVRNRALNYLRNNQTRILHENKAAQEQADQWMFYDQEFDYRELENSINQAISELPDKCRQIFELSRKENLTYRQIAEHLNVSSKTVENQVSIAIKKLRDKLSGYMNIFL